MERGLEKFDALLMKHIAFGTSNFFGALFQGLALCTDISMLMLGGDLKHKEIIYARLGDVLSHLYLASATLKHYEDQGQMVSDLPFVQYAVERNLYLIGKAFEGFFQNFPNKVVGAVLGSPDTGLSGSWATRPNALALAASAPIAASCRSASSRSMTGYAKSSPSSNPPSLPSSGSLWHGPSLRCR